MTIWQRIKHWCRFHGKDNEWLDGRFFPDYVQRTYHCNTCGVVYFEYGNIPAADPDAELTRLRRERDARESDLKKYLEKRFL